MASITLAFFAFSLAVNILATTLIVGRIAFYRYQLSIVLGSSHVSQYTGIIAMIVESEILYTAFLVLFIVPFTLNSPVMNIPAQAMAPIQVSSYHTH